MLCRQTVGAAAMQIYGDTNSGNCLKVKWVCDKLALPYDWIEIDTRKGETRTPQFLAMTASRASSTSRASASTPSSASR